MYGFKADGLGLVHGSVVSTMEENELSLQESERHLYLLANPPKTFRNRLTQHKWKGSSWMQAKLIFAKSKTGEYDIEGHLKFMVYSQRSTFC